MTCLTPSSLLGGTSRNRDPRGAGDVYTQYFTVTPTLVLTRRFLLEHYAAPHEPSSQRVEGEFTPSTSLSPPQWFWLEGSPPQEPRSQESEGEFTLNTSPSPLQWFRIKVSSVSSMPHSGNRDPRGWRGSLHPVPHNGSYQRVPP